MKLRIILLILFITSLSAFARIGETLEQCKERYGSPTYQSDGYATFERNGFSICVSFYNQKAGLIAYSKLEKGIYGKPAELSGTEIKTLLASNAAGEWEEGHANYKTAWQSADGSIKATVTDNQELLLISDEYANHLSAKKREEESQNLQGF